MIKASVKYYGSHQDEYGMPNPYHSYLVVSTPWVTSGSGVASAIPMSTDTPAPSPPHKITTNGGEEQAYQEMIQTLRGMAENKDLKELIDKD